MVGHCFLPFVSPLASVIFSLFLPLGQGPCFGVQCCQDCPCCRLCPLPMKGMDIQFGEGLGTQQGQCRAAASPCPCCCCLLTEGRRSCLSLLSAAFCCLLCLGSERHEVLLFLWRSCLWSTCRQKEEEGGEGVDSMAWRQLPWHTAVPFVLASPAVSFGKKPEY